VAPLESVYSASVCRRPSFGATGLKANIKWTSVRRPLKWNGWRFVSYPNASSLYRRFRCRFPIFSLFPSFSVLISHPLKHSENIGFEVLMAVSKKMAGFWVVLHAVWYKFTSVSRWTPWWWRQQGPLKRQTSTGLHGATKQKTAIIVIQKIIMTKSPVIRNKHSSL
jgi:hypothetical protein